jgi:hypothetical protein
MLSWKNYKSIVSEAVQNVRYSVEVNYDTSQEDAVSGFTKICLGYISAALKKMEFHTKIILTQKPFRVIVASRNWDDGEWVGMISYNDELDCFVVSRGYYNKMNKTVRVEKTVQMPLEYSAKDISKYVFQMMKDLKGVKDKHSPEHRKVHLRKNS